MMLSGEIGEIGEIGCLSLLGSHHAAESDNKLNASC